MRTKLHAGEKITLIRHNENSFWLGIGSVAWWGPGDVGVADTLFLTPENKASIKQGIWLIGTFYTTNQRIIFEGDNVDKNKIIALEKVDSFNLLSDGIEVLEENRPEQKFRLPEPSAILKHLEVQLHKCIIQKAKHCEEVLDYEKAIKLWGKIGKHDQAKRIRETVMKGRSRTVIHGDYVDDRDTIVKDSVINRSNVGGGSSKMEELKELTEMKEKGLIDDDEFKQMKKEILGK